MLRVLIVDDERLARSALKRLLISENEVIIVGEAENIQDTIKEIREKNPNLIFMDIELRNSNGFDIFNKLERPPIVVFVTAYGEYAVKAFAVNAVDYLLKPISQSRLSETLKRVREKLSAERFESSAIKTIDLRVPGRTVIVSPQEIAALRADGDFTHVILVNAPKVMICRTLASLEKELEPPSFLRIGRSVIINLKLVRDIITDKKAGSVVKLDGVDENLLLGPVATARLRKALGF